MTSLRHAWASLAPQLTLLQPLPFPAAGWALLERLHAGFNDRDAHTRLPLAVARVRPEACRAIHALARRCDDVETVIVDAPWERDGAAEPMAAFARQFNADVDALMAVLVPAARYRKGHYAYGRFTVPAPHGLHTDHSAEDPAATGEPICIARIATLGTHYVAGDDRARDAGTRRRLEALRYWTPLPEGGPGGEPEALLDALLAQGILRTIPVDHVVLMVAGNASPDTQVTQHMAARPPAGGL
ncbi:MAG: hypothetical protein IT561_16450, partial [Alphaproteobacteria bacterium]|nr:hypothetical protein [Alphaproteobacteria bacterium]